MTNQSQYQGNRYNIVHPPIADCDYIADLGDRLMFRHAPLSGKSSQLFRAPKGVINAGWVVGIFI